MGRLYKWEPFNEGRLYACKICPYTAHTEEAKKTSNRAQEQKHRDKHFSGRNQRTHMDENLTEENLAEEQEMIYSGWLITQPGE